MAAFANVEQYYPVLLIYKNVVFRILPLAIVHIHIYTTRPYLLRVAFQLLSILCKFIILDFINPFSDYYLN